MASFSLVQFMVPASFPIPEAALLAVIDIRVVLPTELVSLVIGPDGVDIILHLFSLHSSYSVAAIARTTNPMTIANAV